MCKEYNGWKNYQTWCVKAYFDNNGDDSMMREIARNSNEDSNPRYYVVENVKEYVQGMNPIQDGADMFTDILQAALDDVDWYAIADAYLADVADEEDEDQVCYYCGDEFDGELVEDSDGDYVCDACHAEHYTDATVGG